eukprot:Ihof_evm6s356 gene=Ihof_evmTU6s356
MPDDNLVGVELGPCKNDDSPLLSPVPDIESPFSEVNILKVDDYQWWYILPAIMLQYVAVGISISIIPDANLDFFGDRLMQITGLFESLSGMTAFILSPIIGSLSDRYGRQKIMVMCAFLANLQFFVLLFTKNMWVYVVMHIAGGLLNSYFALSFAYIADCTPQEKRGMAFGLTQMTFFVSLAVGGVVGVVIKGHVSEQTVWLVTSAMICILMVYNCVVIPDFVHPSQRQRRAAHNFTWEAFNPFKCFRNIPVNPECIKLGVATFFSAMVYFGFVLTLFLYTTQYMAFSAKDRAILIAVIGLFGGLSGGLLHPTLNKLGPKCTILLGLVGLTLTVGLAGLCHGKVTLFLAVSLNLIGGLTFPAINAIVSNMSEAEDQGCVQGAIMGIKAL